MVHRRCLQVTAIGFLLLLRCTLGCRADTRVALRPDMIVNESGLGDAADLIDEQNAAGDPATGKGTPPSSPFFPGWSPTFYPAHVVIDLGIARSLTRVYFYNESGDSQISLATGTPLVWKTQQLKLGGYHKWNEFPLNVTSRYLRITLLSPVSLPELVLYGTGTEPAHPAKALLKRTRTQRPMDQFLGTNAFIDDPLDKLAAPVGFVREYHNWQWDTEGNDKENNKNKQVRLQPSGAAGGNSWFFDDYYARLKALNVTVCPAIQQSNSSYFSNTNGDAKPVSAGDDPETPASYKMHAAHLFQYAARYGSTLVPDSLLHLAPRQPRRTGLNSLAYIENWNEPDKTWRGREGRFTPYELAAMCSADYDGDQGRMGKTVGVRNADPKMRLVMGGLAGIHLDYLRAMKFWADIHRNGDFPADVLNLHHYSSDGTDEQGFKMTGISPEADHLREKFAAVVAWRNANVPKCEVWVTEFGYDTDPRSPLHAPAIGAYSPAEVQAIWLLRSYLALAAAGVDRAAMFMFRDTKSSDGGVFATCGLVTEKGQWTPKPSYYYLATLKKRLTGMRFEGEVASGKADVLVYRFSGAGGKSAYVVWCPTSEDRRVPRVMLAISGVRVTRIDFDNASLEGKASQIPVRQGTISVDASEKPILLLVP